MIVQLIVQIEMKIDEDQLIVAVFKRKTRDLFPNVEVTERDRPIYGPTLTADDRRVMNRINAILVVCKEVIRSDDPSSGSDSDNSDDNRRRRPRRGRGRGHGRGFSHGGGGDNSDDDHSGQSYDSSSDYRRRRAHIFNHLINVYTACTV